MFFFWKKEARIRFCKKHQVSASAWLSNFLTEFILNKTSKGKFKRTSCPYQTVKAMFVVLKWVRFLEIEYLLLAISNKVDVAWGKNKVAKNYRSNAYLLGVQWSYFEATLLSFVRAVLLIDKLLQASSLGNWSLQYLLFFISVDAVSFSLSFSMFPVLYL